MSRSALLSAYDKLAALLAKLPGSLQKPVLRELEPIKEIFLRQRAPRIAFLGAKHLELPSLVNALAGRAALNAPLARGPWTPVRGAGLVEIADLRGPANLAGEPADLFVHVAVSADVDEARRTAEVLSSAAPREGGAPAGLAVVVLGDAGVSAAVCSALAEADASSSIVLVAHLPRTAAEKGITADERSDLGSRLCDFVPEDAQLELARFLHARDAQARLAGTVLTSFGAVAGLIGVQPIPLADFPVLFSLQMFMVSLIIYTGGRKFSLRLAGEFAASLGIGFGAGLAFRETARAAVRIIPVWGNFISGGVAGAGTYALGRAAIAYFIEGRRPGRIPWLRFHRKKTPVPPRLAG